MNNEFNLKLNRIENIKNESPVYQEILLFFEKLLKYKSDYSEALKLTIEPIPVDERMLKLKLTEGFPLLNKKDLVFDYPFMKTHFLSLLAIIGEKFEAEATQVKTIVDEEDGFKNLIQTVLEESALEENYPKFLPFLLNETINPLLEVHASYLKNKVLPQLWRNGYCPVCGGKPLMGMLKGEEGKKFLICSACSTEWQFLRMKCPFCGIEEQKKLSYFVVENDERYRVETCDNCHTYMKIVDFRKMNQQIFFDVENIGTLHLDIIAHEKGYDNQSLTNCQIHA